MNYIYVFIYLYLRVRIFSLQANMGHKWPLVEVYYF